MEIESINTIKGMKCYTIKTYNKLVSYQKILKLLDNLDDYKDKEGNIDIDCIKEDLLDYRTHIVKLNDTSSPEGFSCTCKGFYFKKGKCRHIKFVLNKL
ncbi:MAG: SWIM zinc finger family protein [Candidatus Thorarchaeota archaeon]